MTTTKEKGQAPENIAAKQAKIMTLPLPQILDELESYIRRVDEAVKQAQTAAKESRDAAGQAKVSGEKAAEAARKAAETAVARIKEEAAEAANVLMARISELEKELRGFKEKVNQEVLAIDRAFLVLKDTHAQGSPFIEE
jgi:hypothetical protein